MRNGAAVSRLRNWRGACMTAILAMAKGVPIWAWALVAALAWGGWQRHLATSRADTLRHAEAQAAAEQIQAAQAAASETARRLQAQEEVSRAAQARAQANARAAADARAAAERVRVAAQSLAASAAAGDPAAPDQCEAARAAGRLLADLLGRAVTRAAVLADHADQARGAGQACEAAYQALGGVK